MPRIVITDMTKKIVFCNCSSERIKPERLKTIEESLISANLDIIRVDDICSASVLEKENGLEEAIYRRTDHWIFEAG